MGLGEDMEILHLNRARVTNEEKRSNQCNVVFADNVRMSTRREICVKCFRVDHILGREYNVGIDVESERKQILGLRKLAAECVCGRKINLR